ncbi:hypothetical protein ACIRVK_28270 [Streptomyces sp. NPDC101152]|uniref:hypothetical protein n=1 Tax=Streptomyces sp. NPDC101152 TaxID=3366116 RepID=UPI00380214D0
MTQSGQGEKPSPREAREGIVLPSDGGEPLLPGMLNAAQDGTAPGSPGNAGTSHYGGPPPAGPQSTGAPPAPAAPPGGQSWGTPWGPEQHQTPAPPAATSWPTPPDQTWGGTADQWSTPAAQPLLPEGQGSAPLPPGTFGAPLPPAADEGATQYIPPVPAAPAPGTEGATQYLPPVVGGDEGATQYIPPVAPGALPPEVGGPVGAEATQYLGRTGAGPLPPAVGPDAQATQYIPPVSDQAPYGAQPGGDRQPPSEFDNLFRSGPAANGPAGATQHLPRFEQPPAQSPYAQPPYGQQATPSYGGQPPQGPHGPQDTSGGRGRSKVPLIAAIGVGIVVIGVGAGAMLGGGGGGGKAKNQTVSATAPATQGSASAGGDAAKQQAVALDKLLADSGNSRAAVISAVANVKNCSNLDTAASDLRDAATQRTQLVTRLSGLSVDRLPNHAALTTALTRAWKASAAADNHYAAWADQVAGNKKSCKKGQARNTGQTAAGNRASGTASEQKAKAADLWNGLARTYGLTQRQPTQL